MAELLFALQVDLQSAGEVKACGQRRGLILHIVGRRPVKELEVASVVGDQQMASSERKLGLESRCDGGEKITPFRGRPEDVVREHFRDADVRMQQQRPRLDALLFDDPDETSGIERIDSGIGKGRRLVQGAQNAGVGELRQPEIPLPAEDASLRERLHCAPSGLLRPSLRRREAEPRDKKEPECLSGSPRSLPTQSPCGDPIPHVVPGQLRLAAHYLALGRRLGDDGRPKGMIVKGQLGDSLPELSVFKFERPHALGLLGCRPRCFRPPAIEGRDRNAVATTDDVEGTSSLRLPQNLFNIGLGVPRFGHRVLGCNGMERPLLQAAWCRPERREGAEPP